MSDFVARRIIRVGSSVAVTLPRRTASKLGFNLGDVVAIVPEGRTLRIQHVQINDKERKP